MTNNKAREVNNPIIKQLIDETNPEELAKIDTQMTNNKQLTAVEWFAKQMEILHYDYWAEHISKDEKNQRLKQLKEQAKEMESRQIMNAFHTNSQKWFCNEEAEQYYEKTYGGGEQ
jgi:hypothetical protein